MILNIWATWCGPCVNELPYFDQIYSEYQDTAAVLAIHSDLITDDVSEFLSNFDFSLPIAVDETGDIVQLLGATTMLPQTVVIDKNGIVTYNSVGSVTYEKLEEFITG